MNRFALSRRRRCARPRVFGCRGVVVRVLVGAAVLVLAVASPAAADPAEPTNDRAEILEVRPATPGVAIDVVGGDSFLRIRVEPGRTVEVPGYDGEPYVRIDPDGAVFENVRSPATVLNRDRYGAVAAPGTDPKAEPVWERVGGGGSHLWHDHRIHWMGRLEPPQLAGAEQGLIFEWAVPVVVDGAAVEVRGRLVRTAAPTVWPWLVAALVAGVAGGLALRRTTRPNGPGRAAVLAAAGALAAVLSSFYELSIPSGAGRRYAVAVVAAIGAASALAAIVWRRRPEAWALGVASALILAGWVWLQRAAATHAVLPSSLDPVVVRAVVALTAAAVIAVAVAALRLPARHSPPVGVAVPTS